MPGHPIVQFVARPGILDLGWGHPHPDLLPVAEWREASEATLDSFGWQALTYGYAAGPGPLVEWLAARNSGRASGARGKRGDPAGVFVTAGASHALSLLCQLLTTPGDTVLVDTPTYHLALRIFRDHGLRLAPVGSAGSLVADAKFLYTVPTFGNPTGRSLPEEDRHSLVLAAKRAGVPIIEDDTYRELVYDGTAPASLWELSGGTGVIRVGSFAKTVAPGLRLGWIDADPALVDRLTKYGYVDSGGGVNHATALTMATFASSGAYERHVARLRAAYRSQRDALAGAMDVPVAQRPAGGWFLWRRLPPGISGAALRPVAERHGVSFVEGTRFFVDGRGDDHIRLSFSMLSPADLVEAARRLRLAMEA